MRTPSTSVSRWRLRSTWASDRPLSTPTAGQVSARFLEDLGGWEEGVTSCRRSATRHAMVGDGVERSGPTQRSRSRRPRRNQGRLRAQRLRPDRARTGVAVGIPVAAVRAAAGRASGPGGRAATPVGTAANAGSNPTRRHSESGSVAESGRAAAGHSESKRQPANSASHRRSARGG